MTIYCCPFCQGQVEKRETGNGGTLYVAEDMEECTECFDPDINMYKCLSNPKHLFYAK